MFLDMSYKSEMFHFLLTANQNGSSKITKIMVGIAQPYYQRNVLTFI